jgi:hypothetical protein
MSETITKPGSDAPERVMPSAAGVENKAPLPSAYDVPIEDIIPAW